MAMLLCNHCINEKDQADEKGEGLQWSPNCDGTCQRVAYILRDMTHKIHTKPNYADEKVECMWVFKEDEHYLSFLFFYYNVDYFHRST